MKEAQMQEIAFMLSDALALTTSKGKDADALRRRVRRLVKEFPSIQYTFFHEI